MTIEQSIKEINTKFIYYLKMFNSVCATKWHKETETDTASPLVAAKKIKISSHSILISMQAHGDQWYINRPPWQEASDTCMVVYYK